MDDLLLNTNAMDFGLTIFLLVVLTKLADIAKQIFLAKKLPATVPTAMLACQTDPKHFQRIMDIHRLTLKTEDEKHEGKYSCQFKNRDEVVLLIHTLEENANATKGLTEELRLTRNGNGRK